MVQMVFGRMYCVKLKTDTIEFYFSYNEILENDENFKAHIIKSLKNIEIMENETAYN